MNKAQACAAGYEFHGAAVQAFHYDYKHPNGQPDTQKVYIDSIIAEIKKAGYAAIKVRATAKECGGTPFVEVYVEPRYFIDSELAQMKTRLAALPERHARELVQLAKKYADETVAVQQYILELEQRLAALDKGE